MRRYFFPSRSLSVLSYELQLVFLLSFICTASAQPPTSVDGASAPNGTTVRTEWVIPAPKAELVDMKTRIEAQGGQVLTLSPERTLLVRYPGDKAPAIRALKDVMAIAPMMTPAREPEPPGRGLGERPPTPEEAEYIRQSYTRTDRIEPNDLSMDRALLDGRDMLPGQVDNSLSIYFPPIRSQGSQGSCVAWATAYYYNTYTQAMDENLTVSGGNNDHICSPAFIYNLINGGVDGGANTSVAMARLNDVGCCSWTLMPYNQSDWTTWPSEAGWVDAMQRRTASSSSIGTAYSGCNDTELEAIKQHLANGNIAATRTDVYSNWYSNYPNDTTGINNGVLFANDGSLLGGHGMTIVGYDDNKSYFDGSTTKYGAFLIANSWGSGWGVTNTGGSNKGYMWVAYDFFKASNNCFGVAYFNTDRDNYRSQLYAVTGLNHAQRGRVRHRGGVGSTSAPSWTSYYPISLAGGTSLAIDDTKPVAVDLTDGIPYLTSPDFSLFTQLTLSSAASSNGTISIAVFYHDLDGDGSFISGASSDPPVTVAPGGTGYATMQFTVGEYLGVDVSPNTWVIGPQSLNYIEEAGPFTVQNTGNVAQDFTIKGSNGANGWTLSSTPGQDAFRTSVDKDDDGSYEIVLTTTDQPLSENVAVSATNTFGLRYEGPTADTKGAGLPQDFTITITASKYVP